MQKKHKCFYKQSWKVSFQHTNYMYAILVILRNIKKNLLDFELDRSSKGLRIVLDRSSKCLRN